MDEADPNSLSRHPGAGVARLSLRLFVVKALDRLATRVAREIRLLEQALKATNAKTAVDAHSQDDDVLGELS